MKRHVLVLTAVVSLLFAIAPPGATAHQAGKDSFTYYSYTNGAGTRKYMVYVPANHRPGMPLIVDLPGCSETAAVEARRSQFNRVAARLGMLVAYPEQDPAANTGRCWNWFEPADQTRGAGEASIIAGITRTVLKHWHGDASRTYVFGISAGGAMADVMAVTYPDLYAAVGVYAGCEYRGLPCLSSAPVQPWHLSAQLAHDEMGVRARAIPAFVVQGDADPLVPLPNSLYIVQQWLNDDLLAAHQAMYAGYWNPDQTRQGRKPGPSGQAYEVWQWHGATGCELAQMWLVHGMGHQWSNAANSGDVMRDASSNDLVLNDPDGPDITTPAARFFLQHRMTPPGSSC